MKGRKERKEGKEGGRKECREKKGITGHVTVHINLQEITQSPSVEVIPKKYIVLAISYLGREVRIVSVLISFGCVLWLLSYLKKMANFTCHGVLDTGKYFLDLFKRNI